MMLKKSEIGVFVEEGFNDGQEFTKKFLIGLKF